MSSTRSQEEYLFVTESLPTQPVASASVSSRTRRNFKDQAHSQSDPPTQTVPREDIDEGPSFKDQTRAYAQPSRNKKGPSGQEPSVLPILVAQEIEPVVVEPNAPHQVEVPQPASTRGNGTNPRTFVCIIAATAALTLVGGIVVGVLFAASVVGASNDKETSLRVFETTQELYRAVDLYMVDTSLTLEYGKTISDWDVSRIRIFDRLFNFGRQNDTCISITCPYWSFNFDLSRWNTSSAVSMHSMFLDVQQFNQDLSSWDVSRVTEASLLFAGAIDYNRDLSSWNVSSVSSLESIFNFASSFNQDISAWDVSSVTTMDNAFLAAEAYNQDLSRWDTANVKSMYRMFFSAKAFNQDVTSWNVNLVSNMTEMFLGAAAFNQSLCAWTNKLPLETVDVTRMFRGTSCPVSSETPDLTPDGDMCHVC